MPLTIRFDPEAESPLGKGMLRPTAVCDACGKEIENAERGVYLNDSTDAREGRDVAVVVAHEGACHDQMEAELRRGGKSPGWNRLHHYILQLAYNSGTISEEEARRLRTV